MNEIELNRLKIELNSKTLHTKNKNIYLNEGNLKTKLPNSFIMLKPIII